MTPVLEMAYSRDLATETKCTHHIALPAMCKPKDEHQKVLVKWVRRKKQEGGWAYRADIFFIKWYKCAFKHVSGIKITKKSKQTTSSAWHHEQKKSFRMLEIFLLEKLLILILVLLSKQSIFPPSSLTLPACTCARLSCCFSQLSLQPGAAS